MQKMNQKYNFFRCNYKSADSETIMHPRAHNVQNFIPCIEWNLMELDSIICDKKNVLLSDANELSCVPSRCMYNVYGDGTLYDVQLLLLLFYLIRFVCVSARGSWGT